MSLYQSPKIVTDGLAFYYDMNNRPKSFIGPPRTNYIPNPYASWNGSNFVLGYNYANLGATYTYRTDVQNPINAPGVLEYYTGTTGYKYFSIDSTAVPTTGTYTFSYYARLTNSSANNVNNSQLWRANGSDRSVSGDWNPTYTSTWRRYTTSGPIEAGTILQYFPIHSGSITGGYTIQFCGFQLEFDSYATPFVDGTRSNTQSILDLTTNNTITASSLTYASDGTFSFDRAASNSIVTNLPITATRALSNFTYEVILNVTGLPPASNNGVVLGATYYAGAAIYWRTSGSNFNIRGFIRGADAYRTTAEYTLSLNTVYHVAMTNNYSAGTLNLYVNGILFSSVATATQEYNPSLTPGLNIGINLPQVDGGGAETYSYFTGKVHLAKVYYQALTAAQVQQNFNALRGRYGI